MTRRTVIIADASPSGTRLARSISDAGFDVIHTATLKGARQALSMASVDYLLTESRHPDGRTRDFIHELRVLSPNTRIVVITANPSIESAIRLLRLGVSEYLTKPVTECQVLRVMGAASGHAEKEWMTIDRASADYIEDVLVACGSIAKTARVLGLDRRSLRRMLNRHRARERAARSRSRAT